MVVPFDCKQFAVYDPAVSRRRAAAAAILGDPLNF
jgi:hypothetical protein